MSSYPDAFGADKNRLGFVDEADEKTVEKTRVKVLAEFLRRRLNPLNKRLEGISALVAGIMSVPIFLDVTARMIFGKSIPGIIEAEEFMMILIVFLALAFLQADKEHVSIDLLYARLPERMKAFVDIFNPAICFVVFSLMGWQTEVQVGQKMGEVSFSLGIPISIFLGVAAFGIFLLALVLLTELLEAVAVMQERGGWPWVMAAFVPALFVLILPFLVKMLPGRFTGLPLGLAGMGALFLLLLLRMPIGFAMAVTGFLGILIISKNVTAPLSMLGIAPYHATASFILAVVPLFVLMGELAFHSGISRDLFDSAYKWLGRLPGGLAMSAVAGCAGFAAVCGDSMSTAVTMGAVSLPEMEKKNYNPGLATGSLAAGELWAF